MKSADYRNAPMEKMSWNVFIGVVLGQIVSSYTLGIVGVALDRVPSSMTLSSTWLGLLGAGSLIGLSWWGALPTAMGAGSFSWPICSP